jgi:putative transposase
MTNHFHAILSSSRDNLSNIIHDFKKFTSTQIIEAIEQNGNESRSRWSLWLLKQKTETGEDKKQLWRSGEFPS